MYFYHLLLELITLHLLSGNFELRAIRVTDSCNTPSERQRIRRSLTTDEELSVRREGVKSRAISILNDFLNALPSNLNFFAFHDSGLEYFVSSQLHSFITFDFSIFFHCCLLFFFQTFICLPLTWNNEKISNIKSHCPFHWVYNLPDKLLTNFKKIRAQWQLKKFLFLDI